MQIHYFQRYHSKENVDTSNTMLMLSRLYNYNADKFFSMLNSLILGEDESPEITFDLQVVGDDSVPDAVISQKSFKIVVETKLYNQFYKQQLVNHLEQFGAEDIKVLLTLDPKPMKPQLFDELAVELKEYNSENATRLIHPIKHVNLTFEQLVNAMEDIVDDRDTEIIAVLDDFKKYCFDEKLIPDGYKWMRAIVAGTTFQDNMDLDLFYDQESRNFSEHGYIGLYKDKSIRAIGKLKKTVIAVENNGSMTYRAESGAEPKKGLPDDWAEFMESVFEFMSFYGWGEIMNPSVYGKVRRCDDDIIYCSVEFEDGCKSYYYISDDDSIQVGDFVIVPAGKDNHEAVVEVVKKEYFTEEDVPLPMDKTKHIIRKCTDADFDLPDDEPV